MAIDGLGGSSSTGVHSQGKSTFQSLDKITELACDILHTLSHYTIKPINRYVVTPITDFCVHIATTIKTSILLIVSYFDLYDFDEVRKNPGLYLQSFLVAGLPNRVTYLYDYHAIDAGGLTKQLVTSLCEGLLENNYFLRSENGFPLIRESVDQEPISEVAQFFSIVYSKRRLDHKQYLTGEIFHPRFFELVLIAASNQSQEEKIKAATRLILEINPAIKMQADVILNPTEENLEAYAKLFDIDHEEARKTAKEDILTYLNAAQAFYNGSSDELRLSMRRKPVEFLKELQGEPVTIDNLLRALNFSSYYISFPKNQREWIEEKIRNSDAAWRKKFVFAITGSTTLNPGQKICICNTDHPEFKFATCTSTLYIPRDAKDKETFLAALDSMVDSDDFNTA